MLKVPLCQAKDAETSEMVPLLDLRQPFSLCHRYQEEC